MTAFQFLPPLSEEDYEALKADIANRGVQVAVEYDQDGEVLDGHYRLRACKELGITEWPTRYRTFGTDAERRTHARQLNLARRHLTPEQRRQLIADELREAPQRSNRQIADGLKVDNKTVQAVRAVMEADEEIPQVRHRVAADGKSRPASQHKPKTRSQHDADVMALARAWEMACQSAREQFLRSLGYEQHQSETTEGGDHVTAFTQEQDSEAAVHAVASTAADKNDAEHQRSEPGERAAAEGAQSPAAGVDSPTGGNGSEGHRGGSETPGEESGPAGEGENPFRCLKDEWPECPPSLLRDPSNPLGRRMGANEC